MLRAARVDTLVSTHLDSDTSWTTTTPGTRVPPRSGGTPANGCCFLSLLCCPGSSDSPWHQTPHQTEPQTQSRHPTDNAEATAPADAAGKPIAAQATPFSAGQPVVYIGETTDPVSDQLVAYEVTLTVKDFECDRTQIAGSRFTEPVHSKLGKFCVGRFDVTNTGAVPVSWSATQSSLVDDRGRTFTVASEATSQLAIFVEDRQTLPHINPTETFADALVFDMPTDGTPMLVHLRDSFQTGVDIAL
jgi:hypothetical protein